MNLWPLPLSLSPWGVSSKPRQQSSDRWENETVTAAAHLLEQPTALLVCVDLLLQSSPYEWPPSVRFCYIHYDTTASESHSVYEINSVQSWHRSVISRGRDRSCER